MDALKKLNSNDFKKDSAEKLVPFVTSVTLDKRHQEYLSDENINLSKLVRAVLDIFIAQKKSGEK